MEAEGGRSHHTAVRALARKAQGGLCMVETQAQDALVMAVDVGGDLAAWTSLQDDSHASRGAQYKLTLVKTARKPTQVKCVECVE